MGSPAHSRIYGWRRRRSRKGCGMARISLELEGRLLPRFSALLTKGVIVRCRTGGSLRDFLCEQLRVPEPYLEQRVHIFVPPGKAVDDYATATVTDGASSALSAAMPGLVGAVLCRGGLLAGLRDSITHRSDESAARALNGTVTVKLFNLTVKELGPLLLSRGAGVTAKDLLELFEQFADDFRAGCRRAALDDRPLSFDQLTAALADRDQVDLRVGAASD